LQTAFPVIAEELSNPLVSSHDKGYPANEKKTITDLMRRSFIIAEMACSHDGSVELAEKIIDGAIEAGADAIQFQIWKHQDMVVPSHPDIDLLRKLELSHPQWEKLTEYVRKKAPEMEIIACVYDSASGEFAHEIGVSAFKIHTADLSNPLLLRKIAEFGKRIDLSVGSSTFEEISDAISWIGEEGDPKIWLMYGKQLFPTEVADAEILQAVTLANTFELPVGYQDHSDADSDEAFSLPIAARGAGLWIQEKHITHDRAKKGADHQAALNPEEFKRFVDSIRTIDLALGDPRPHPFTESEKKYRKYSKKSLVTSHSIEKGHLIEESDTVSLRVESIGIPPSQIELILGKRTSKPIEPFSVIQMDDLE
jgi:N,N'-diacetyllegionaminate synthase